tara:strand:+ start:1360 stop:2502 length:1143 start_codon:yes stop_codon:yes gene_type:complete
MKNQEELYILKKVLIHKWLEDTVKDPAKVRQENNQITDFKAISYVFDQMNRNSKGREIHIPISFFLSSKELDASCSELIEFSKSKQIHFEKEMQLNNIYLLGFKPIKGSKRLAISIVSTIRGMVQKRTRKDNELIIDLQFREDIFNQKDIPHYLIFSRSWIKESARKSDNILIKLYDIFDKKKYRMGLTDEEIKKIKEYDSRVRKRDVLKDLEKEKEKEENKKARKERKKERRKERRSAKKIQKWFLKIRWYHLNLLKINLYLRRQFAVKIQKNFVIKFLNCWKSVVEKKKHLITEKKEKNRKKKESSRKRKKMRVKKEKKSAEKIQKWWFKILRIKYEKVRKEYHKFHKMIESREKLDLLNRFNPNVASFVPSSCCSSP